MMLRSRFTAFLFAGLSTTAAFAPAAAWAHGRFPQAGQVVVDPQDDQRIWVRTTYGIITTDDGGGQWRWLCPDAVGFDADKEDPPIGLMLDGRAVAGTFDGLSTSAEGCDFSFVPEVEGRFVIDLVVEPSHTSAVALASNGLAADTFEVKLFDSGDQGASWSEIGTSPPTDFLALTLGVSGSDPQRLYVTGRDGMAGVYEGALMRSDDRGASWNRLAIPTTEDGSTLPYLGGVDPDDADRFYVATIRQDMGVTIAYNLLVTEDGGASFQTIFEREEAMAGFALSPDGQTIAIGGSEAGLWLASADDYAFSKVNPIHVRCLTWHDSGLYACADQFIDGYNLGVSTDAGESFTELSQLTSPCGPPDCGGDTTVGMECPSRWPEERAELGAEDCDAGTGGAGGAPTGEGGGGDGGGCGCKLDEGPAPPSEGAAWLLVGLGLVALRRRRA